MAESLYTTRNVLSAVRKLILIVFVIGLFGTGGELLLIGHTDGYQQWIPIVLMAFSVAVLFIHWIFFKPLTVRLFQLTMIMFVLSSLAGIWLHYQGNLEFELEMYPASHGFELFKQSVSGASPTLAPGAMLQLGLLGLVYSYRHPLNN